MTVDTTKVEMSANSWVDEVVQWYGSGVALELAKKMLARATSAVEHDRRMGATPDRQARKDVAVELEAVIEAIYDDVHEISNDMCDQSDTIVDGAGEQCEAQMRLLDAAKTFRAQTTLYMAEYRRLAAEFVEIENAMMSDHSDPDAEHRMSSRQFI